MKFFGALIAAVYAKDFVGGEAPAKFNSSSSYAISSIPGAFTTLYSVPGSGQQSSAQFPYTKIATPSDRVNLATVYLVGTNFKEALQSNFALIPQTCSCYWIDAAELTKKFKTLRSGNYTLLIEEDSPQQPGYHVQSGIFAISIPDSNKKKCRSKAASLTNK